MDELHQFATDLAHSVVEQSMRAVSSNFTNANDTELPITPHGFSNCGKCVNEMFCPQEPFILDNESNSATVKGRDGKYSRPVKLKCYAHDLCCDIISGALHNLDGPVREVSTSKFRGLSSHANNTVNCHQLSTERIELFCYCDKRATITMCAAKRKIANSSGKPKPITRAKKKKLKYKKKLEKELSKTKARKIKSRSSYLFYFFFCKVLYMTLCNGLRNYETTIVKYCLWCIQNVHRFGTLNIQGRILLFQNDKFLFEHWKRSTDSNRWYRRHKYNMSSLPWLLFQRTHL